MSDASKIIFFYLWCGLRGHEKTNPHKNIEADPLENRVVAGVGDRRVGDRFAGRCGASLDGWTASGTRRALRRIAGNRSRDSRLSFFRERRVCRPLSGGTLYDAVRYGLSSGCLGSLPADAQGCIRQGGEAQRGFQERSGSDRPRWPSAADRDYTGSGFDRGHLLPSADRNDTPQENGATFRLSNVSPQRPGLNRGTWRRLEERVRRWAARYDSLYIVTGGELTPSLRRIRGGVGIPQRFFKTILARGRRYFPGDRFPDPEYGASGRGLFSLCDQRRQSRTGARHGFLFSAARQRRNARRGLLRPFFLALVPRPAGRFAVPSGRFAAPIRRFADFSESLCAVGIIFAEQDSCKH